MSKTGVSIMDLVVVAVMVARARSAGLFCSCQAGDPARFETLLPRLVLRSCLLPLRPFRVLYTIQVVLYHRRPQPPRQGRCTTATSVSAASTLQFPHGVNRRIYRPS